MDYIEGASLASLLKAARRAGAKLPRGVAVRIAMDALHGLHAAHEQTSLEGVPLRVVHRDAERDAFEGGLLVRRVQAVERVHRDPYGDASRQLRAGAPRRLEQGSEARALDVVH